MEIPKVTIIIANHNYGQYVLGAINSALKQDYPKDRLHIFIVDDGSTDDSVQKIIDTYFEGKRGIFNKVVLDNGTKITMVCLTQAQGPSAARNIAILNTLDDTDIYAVLDADDEYYPQKVLKCVNKIVQSGGNVGVVYADYDVWNIETGNIVREFKEPYSKIRLMQECIVHSGAVITKQALVNSKENNTFYDNAMRTCEDYDLWIRISEKLLMVHIPESLSLVRVHKDNSTFSVKNEIWQANWQRIRDKLAARHNVQ